MWETYSVRENVLAAGGENRTDHEKGGSYSSALYRGGKEEGARSAGKVLVATVKGDVHDIGKTSCPWSWRAITMKL